MPVSFFLPIKNVYIASAYPDQNFANRNQGDVLFVGSFTGADDIYRSLMQFDFSDPNHGIPPNSTITFAQLVLSMYRNDNPDITLVDVYRLVDNFDERTVTFNNRPPAGLSYATIRPPAAPALARFNLTLLVEGWYSGSIPNNGIEIRGTENDDNNIVGFRSTRFADSIFSPMLEVTWSQGTVSRTEFDALSGAPTTSTLVDMRGKDQATFLIRNSTNGNLQGSVLLINSGADPVSDPSTAFSIPAGQEWVINYTAAVDFLRLRFTAAGEGNYFVQAKTRDA